MNYLQEIKKAKLKVKDLAKEMELHSMSLYRKIKQGKLRPLEKEYIEKKISDTMTPSESIKSVRTPENKPEKKTVKKEKPKVETGEPKPEESPMERLMRIRNKKS